MRSKVLRPSHIHNNMIQKLVMPDNILKNHVNGVTRIGLSAPFFTGGSERENMLLGMRSLRDICETNKSVELDFYVSHHPTHGENLSTLDRESLQIMKVLSNHSRINVHLLPEDFDFALMPRIWVDRGENTSVLSLIHI